MSVETYRRTSARLEIEEVRRSPRVTRRRFVYELEDGAITRASMAVTAPGDTAPLRTARAWIDGDSLRAEIRSAGRPGMTAAGPATRGAPVIDSPVPWSVYEMEIARRLPAGTDSARTTMYFLASPRAHWWLALRRLGRDSVEIETQHQDLFRARVDADGLLLGAIPLAGTYQVGANRVASLDLDATEARFLAEEKAGAGVGMLSPRDTLQAEAGGAALWVDYGRPSKRGRVVFGGLVPWGQLWRTGANAATQFRTDRDLDFGGTVVPAGSYTLWTIPLPGGWTLVVNTETGQWGTAHHEDRDLCRIPMKTTALPESVERFTIGVEAAPGGGELRLEWDTTRASAAFTVRP